MTDLTTLEHYLALEPLLGAKIRDLVEPSTQVVPIDQLGTVKDRMHLAAPQAVFFGYAGDELVSAQGGASQRWAQDWWVIVAVRSAGQGLPEVSVLRALGGPLISRLIGADGLGGWTPGRSVFTPLERRQAASRAAYYIGYAEIPLLFRTQLSARATNYRNRS